MTEKRTIKIERTYKALIQDVWDLWTTKEGIESWWGPEGFAVTVRELDLRPGGVLLYAMTATGAPQIEFMKKSGMPLSSAVKITYTEIVAPTRLAYINHVDFVPNVTAYEVATVIELRQNGESVTMIVTLEPMHDEIWTKRAAMGWESEFEKLAKKLQEQSR